MDRKAWTMITRDEEHSFQYASEGRARIAAKMETSTTHRKHQIYLTHTWRDLHPRLCWAVVLQMEWKNGNLVTQ